MGELLRRGFDAQLADRNTKAYDILVGRTESAELRKVQVKTVRGQPRYVKHSSFEGDLLDQVTIYVLIGKRTAMPQSGISLRGTVIWLARFRPPRTGRTTAS